MEDWGCGKGGFRMFRRSGYVGVDGSQTPFADRVVDLATYRSRAPGILLRHVLEHNVQWEAILANAVASFEKKLCVTLFTPFHYRTRQINYIEQLEVPDIAFARKDIERFFDGLDWTLQEAIVTDSEYRIEHAYYVKR